MARLSAAPSWRTDEARTSSRRTRPPPASRWPPRRATRRATRSRPCRGSSTRSERREALPYRAQGQPAVPALWARGQDQDAHAAVGDVVRALVHRENALGLDVKLQQDMVRRRLVMAARNLDTLQRIVHSVFSIWRRQRKKRADRAKGTAELMKHVSASFTKLIRYLCQK